MTEPDSRLARRLGIFDAVVIGLGSMIGAGVFAAVGPAAEVAGSGLLIGLLIAAVIAYCNAASSAQLAAVFPQSGGTYVYGREQLGEFWGFLAGWGFVFGKTASCAAMALTFGTYADPALARPLAVTSVIGVTLVNYLGIRQTAWLTRAIVAVVLAALAMVVTAALAGGTASPDRFGHIFAGGPSGIMQSAGLMFFAFAGYARIATLGEEVREPARNIPRAISLALGITFGVYAVVAGTALAAVGPQTLAEAAAPLDAVVRPGRLEGLTPAVRIGGALASLGVLLSLLAGISRTAFAMAHDGQLPRWLGAVHPHHRVPHRAALSAGLLITAVVLLADLRGAIGFSSFAVLVYYAIANASAWMLPADKRRWPHWMSLFGVAGCLILALTLPWTSVVMGGAMLATGGLLWRVKRRATSFSQ